MGFRVNTTGRVNQQHFSNVPANVAAPRSAFDRSFSHKTTINEGYLYPIFWEPILPGDTINLSTQALIRLSTPIFPYMDNVYFDIHYFFVPNRLLWEHWEQFQGAQDNPPSAFTEYEVPSLDDATHAAGFASLSIYDYFGLPLGVTNIPQASMPIALPFRAYRKIWNDWYREENTQDPLTIDISDGPDTTAYALLKRNRRKDYFTSCLPWPQKGAAVSLPLGSTAPITGIAKQSRNAETNVSGIETGNVSVTYPYGTRVDDATDYRYFIKMTGSGGAADAPEIYADLSAATATTINALRESIVLQQMLELDARGGTRYVEILLARFGVVSPDFRLQRPEYLGGQTIDVNVNPIAQTSVTTAVTPQGNLAGFAVGRGKASINHSFVEHGQLLCLASVRADTSYQQGMSRHWSVRTRYDYYEPLAANLGEQAVLNKELAMIAGAYSASSEDAFGYQERWAEYRYKASYVTGLFRTASASGLDSWHLALSFNSMPTLADLMPEEPPIARIVAVADEPHFILDTFTKFRHVRVLPVYSAPGLTRL
ncbi:major capsid protein [Apis mellifera associated microvirus 31]|nr:major capsid protein [Apis mellifera associated microvirus 31]